MITIELPVDVADVTIMSELENRGIIQRLVPPGNCPVVEAGDTHEQVVYATDPVYGAHKIVFVKINETVEQIRYPLNYHPDKETVLLISSAVSCKPLIFVFSYSHTEELGAKIAARSLSPRDFTAVQIPFNIPSISFFTVTEYIPHFEVTRGGPGESPSFWVAEPRDLPLIYFEMPNYRFSLSGLE